MTNPFTIANLRTLLVTSLLAVSMGFAPAVATPTVALGQVQNGASQVARQLGAAGRKRLSSRLRAVHARQFMRTAPGRPERLYARIDNSTLSAAVAALGPDSEVLQISHSSKPDAFHTMAVFDGELLHTQYSPAGHWRMRSWGGSLRIPNPALLSALIQLSPTEAARLRTLLTAAAAEQGPEENAGENWANGHLKLSLGNRSLNCASTWTEMPLGDNGEPLYQLIGLSRSYSGSPRELQMALERDGNDRVFGIFAYGEGDPEFDRKREQDAFRL